MRRAGRRKALLTGPSLLNTQLGARHKRTPKGKYLFTEGDRIDDRSAKLLRFVSGQVNKKWFLDIPGLDIVILKVSISSSRYHCGMSIWIDSEMLRTVCKMRHDS